MCLMTIHAGQHSVTMVQAMAHNTATVIGDLEMLASVLDARGDFEASRSIRTIQRDMRGQYDNLMSEWQIQAGNVHNPDDGHTHTAGDHHHDVPATVGAEAVSHG